MSAGPVLGTVDSLDEISVDNVRAVKVDGTGVRVDDVAVGAGLDGGARHAMGRLLKLVKVLLVVGLD